LFVTLDICPELQDQVRGSEKKGKSKKGKRKEEKWNKRKGEGTKD
jgi:hypothetical protein